MSSKSEENKAHSPLTPSGEGQRGKKTFSSHYKFNTSEDGGFMLRSCHSARADRTDAGDGRAAKHCIVRCKGLLHGFVYCLFFYS